MQASSQHGVYKYEGTLSTDRDDFGSEFGDTQASGIGTIVVGLKQTQKQATNRTN
jgi:hypothetical protein